MNYGCDNTNTVGELRSDTHDIRYALTLSFQNSGHHPKNNDPGDELENTVFPVQDMIRNGLVVNKAEKLHLFTPLRNRYRPCLSDLVDSENRFFQLLIPALTSVLPLETSKENHCLELSRC